MTLAGYEIVRELGRGGMAETHLAVQVGAGGFRREVCLKRIAPRLANEASFNRAFLEEARLAALLTHPHIVQVYDFGIDDGLPWMSLEFVRGGDLRSLLDREHTLPLAIVLQLAIDLASALAYAHDLEIDGRPARVVHRDVTPSNVLIDPQGHFKLADFGIAKSTLSSKDTTAGTIKGKPSYMSPEQARGTALDGRTDLWALGVILFEALAGRRPFEAPTELATMLQALQGERPRLEALVPSTPRGVVAIVDRLLAVKREERFGGATQLLEALGDLAPPTSTRRAIATLVQTQRAPVPRGTPQAEAGETVQLTTHLDALEPDTGASPADVTRTKTALDPAPAWPSATDVSEHPPHAAPTTRGAPSRRSILVGSALLGSGVVAASLAGIAALDAFERSHTTVAQRPTTPSSSAPHRVSRPVPVPAPIAPPPSPVPVGFDVPAEPEEHGDSTATATRAARPASVRVVVEPWGRVEVDGRSLGMAPQVVELTPGAHTVVAIADSRRVERRIRVTAGQDRTIVVRIDAVAAGSR